MQVFYGFVNFLCQVIVSIFGLSNKNSSTELQTPDSMDQATILTRVQNTCKDVDKQSDTVVQGQAINKKMPDDETVQSVDSEQSEMRFYAAELQKRKKRCRICRRSSAKQMKFEIEKSSYNGDAYGIVTSGGLQNISRGTEKKYKDIDCISKDASDALNTIEARISALKVGSKHVSSRTKQAEPQEGEVINFASGSVSGIGTSSPNIGKKEGLVSQGAQTQFGHFVLGKNDPHSLSFRRKAWETKGHTRWRQLSRYVMNPMNELKMPNQSTRNSALLSPWNVKPSRSMSKNIGKDNENNLRGNTSQEENLIEGQNYGLQKCSPVHVQNVKANVGKVESMTRSTNSPSRNNSVQGLRIPLNSDKKSRKNFLLQKLPKKTNKAILDGNQVAQKNKLRKVGKTNPSVSAAELIDTKKTDRKLQAYRAGNKQMQTPNKTAETSKGLIHRTTMRQTPLDNKYDQLQRSPVMYRDQVEKCKGKVKKKLNQNGQQKMSLSDQQDSNGTTSNGSSSSSWTTQNGSSSYYDSEEYLVDQSQVKQRSSTMEREGDYVSGSTEGRNSGYTSYSDSELSSVPSSNQPLENSNSSSENLSYLPSDQISSLRSSDPSYRQGQFSRRYSSTDRRRPKIQTGRLKKLKDKLAIIFHHHHHYHHHHYADDCTQSDDQSHEYHGTPLSKHAASMSNKRNQAQAYGEKAAERLSKSMVRHVPNKKRGANFNKLVNGLVRHVRHSKKPKKCKGGIKHQAKDQHIGKKLAKKVHWWQFLRRRPRRMKMPKKPHVKLGFGFKKSKLKAVPTIKWR
ncbi:hypothetical protein POM88_040556 [Heracleum sosnowskyi]|uniref:Uncharacterized protein n=1 Tax=Heracleum sosnowskyi TaxID=360622 RepID=A0AAD8M7I0_9APIA|nr:hypothetical protein POM88_040556 [Heracleum sosnowskyi]